MEWLVHTSALPAVRTLCVGCTDFWHEDSLEHYSRCSVCVCFLRRRIRYLDPIDQGHLLVLGAHRGVADIRQVAKLARWNYVIYSSFNTLRCISVEVRRTLQVQDIMEQHYKESIKWGEEAWADGEDND